MFITHLHCHKYTKCLLILPGTPYVLLQTDLQLYFPTYSVVFLWTISIQQNTCTHNMLDEVKIAKALTWVDSDRCWVLFLCPSLWSIASKQKQRSLNPSRYDEVINMDSTMKTKQGIRHKTYHQTHIFCNNGCGSRSNESWHWQCRTYYILTRCSKYLCVLKVFFQLQMLHYIYF